MKTLREYIELVESMNESSYKLVKNLDGVEKRFSKWASRDEIEAWRNSSPKADKAAQRTSDKAGRIEAQSRKLDSLYRFVVGAVGNTFPDVDAIDTPEVQQYLDRYGFDIEDVDRAFVKHEGKTYHEYMVDMYDQLSADNPDTFDQDDNPWK